MDSLEGVGRWVRGVVEAAAEMQEDLTISRRACGGTSKTSAFFASKEGAALVDVDLADFPDWHLMRLIRTQEEIEETSIALASKEIADGREIRLWKSFVRWTLPYLWEKKIIIGHAPQAMTTDGKYIQYARPERGI